MILSKKTIYVSLGLLLLLGFLALAPSRRLQCDKELEKICSPFSGLSAINRCAPYHYDSFSPICRVQIKYHYLAGYHIMRVRQTLRGQEKHVCRCGDESGRGRRLTPAHHKFHAVRRVGNLNSLALFGQTLATARRHLTEDRTRVEFCGF